VNGRAETLIVCGILALAPSGGRAAPATASETAEPAPSPASSVRSAQTADREPPVILAMPVEPTPAGETLVLRARVTDSSGVREVRALVRGAGDPDYVPVPMAQETEGGDLYAAAIPPTPERGSSVSWLVEATDRLGNGPRRAGDLAAPFMAQLVAGGTAGGALRRVTPPYLAALAAAMVIIPAAGVWRLRSRRRARLRHSLPASPAAGRTAPPARDPRVEEIAEDLFWLRLLTPLVDLPPDELRNALLELLARAHPHPLRGPSRFERHVVLARLRWAQRLDPADVLSRWHHLRGGSRPRAAGRARAASTGTEASL